MILRDKAALRMTWPHFFPGRRNTLQNALVRGRQLCAQLSILEGNFAELLRF